MCLHYNYKSEKSLDESLYLKFQHCAHTKSTAYHPASQVILLLLHCIIVELIRVSIV